MSEPCQACGACCANFRVSFYWAETDAHPDGAVPQALTVPITPHLVAMQGTHCGTPRCVALDGNIGQTVRCTIYPLRSSVCRDFEAGTEACNRARARHGLPALPIAAAPAVAAAFGERCAP